MFRSLWAAWLCMLLVAGLGATLPAKASSSPLELGVYYFPGWRTKANMGNESPWDKIRPYAEREPLLSWYLEGRADVMQQQIDWMAASHITFIAFDWYYGNDVGEALDHSISAYLDAPNRHKVKFTLLWSNHDRSPDSMATFDAMLDVWLARYLNRPEMLKVDGKPVIMIYSPSGLLSDARKFGSTPEALLARAQARVKAKGLPGLYIVGCVSADDPMAATMSAKGSGYDALTAYEIRRKPGAPRLSHSYKELDEVYQAHWDLYRSARPLPLVVPLISGLDRRPWGGVPDDPKHDDSMATPDEFEAHLRRGLLEINKSPAGSPRMGVICCWNEYGEGAYIEPTRQLGTAMIDRVRKVFAPAPTPKAN